MNGGGVGGGGGGGGGRRARHMDCPSLATMHGRAGGGGDGGSGGQGCDGGDVGSPADAENVGRRLLLLLVRPTERPRDRPTELLPQRMRVWLGRAMNVALAFLPSDHRLLRCSFLQRLRSFLPSVVRADSAE